MAPPGGGTMQNARPGGQDGVNVPILADPGSGEWRVWNGVQAALAMAITASLGYGLAQMAKSGADLPLAGWQRSLAWVLLVGGLLVFAVRSLVLLRRFLEPPRRL